MWGVEGEGGWGEVDGGAVGEEDAGSVAVEIDAMEAAVLEAFEEAVAFRVVADDDAVWGYALDCDVEELGAGEAVDDDDVVLVEGLSGEDGVDLVCVGDAEVSIDVMEIDV